MDTSVYVLIGRIQRKKKENQFDRTMLGDLDQAISNVENEVSCSKTFLWWCILPAAIPAFLNISQSDAPMWKWFFLPVALTLAFVVTNWGLKRIYLPRKRQLEALRDLVHVWRSPLRLR